MSFQQVGRSRPNIGGLPNVKIASSATGRVRSCLVGVALVALSVAAQAQTSGAPACGNVDYNAMILDDHQGPAHGRRLQPQRQQRRVADHHGKQHRRRPLGDAGLRWASVPLHRRHLCRLCAPRRAAAQRRSHQLEPRSAALARGPEDHAGRDRARGRGGTVRDLQFQRRRRRGAVQAHRHRLQLSRR